METKLKGAYEAAFSADGAALFINGQRKVRCFDLITRPGRAPRAVERWSASIKHSSSLVPSRDGAILVVSDTSGRHHGLSTTTGDKLWQTKQIGEGHRGLILPDGAYLFISWDGKIQVLDPLTGCELQQKRSIAPSVFSLQSSSQSADLTYVHVTPPVRHDQSPIYKFCGLNLTTFTSINTPIHTESGRLSVSPDGHRIADLSFVRALDQKISVSQTTMRIVARQTGEILQERVLTGNLTTASRPVWSPDLQIVALTSLGKGFYFVDANTLLPIAEIPFRYASHVEFSSDGSLTCLCAWETSILIQTKDLTNWSRTFSAVP
jgi:outer membrane protein assembly factor BamB